MEQTIYPKIRLIDTALPLPNYESSGACAFDIYSRSEQTIMPKAIALLPTNLIITVPTGYGLIIAPRSSLARKKGLVIPNSIGIIDQDYHGDEDEIMLQVMNITDDLVTVTAGERLAQGFFVALPQVQWQLEGERPSQPTATSRGGFGSTGGYAQ